jgi:hypothetical protein
MNPTSSAPAAESSGNSPGREPLMSGYSPEAKQPLPEFAALIGAFAVLVSSAAISLKRGRGALPEPLPLPLLIVLGLATHKVSRVLTVGWVTAALRAPFTRFEEFTGHGEVSERARGGGMRRAIGELVSCPYCAGVWVATGLRLGHAMAPRFTGMAAEIFALAALSDFLQHAYAASKVPTEDRSEQKR